MFFDLEGDKKTKKLSQSANTSTLLMVINSLMFNSVAMVLLVTKWSTTAILNAVALHILMESMGVAGENAEIASGDADPDATLVADYPQNEYSLEHPPMDSMLGDWGVSGIEHSQSMNELSSYFDQPIRSTPAAKRYAPGKRLLQPLLDSSLAVDDITPSEYSTGVTSAFNGYSVIVVNSLMFKFTINQMLINPQYLHQLWFNLVPHK
uniref:Uncharacterized protein n=1 Tax=Panagrolaimus sp. ES5 TaxID=591445 RepID=A0AC34FY60_9BILA